MLYVFNFYLPSAVLVNCKLCPQYAILTPQAGEGGSRRYKIIRSKRAAGEAGLVSRAAAYYSGAEAPGRGARQDSRTATRCV